MQTEKSNEERKSLKWDGKELFTSYLIRNLPIPVKHKYGSSLSSMPMIKPLEFFANFSSCGDIVDFLGYDMPWFYLFIGRGFTSPSASLSFFQELADFSKVRDEKGIEDYLYNASLKDQFFEIVNLRRRDLPYKDGLVGQFYPFGDEDTGLHFLVSDTNFFPGELDYYDKGFPLSVDSLIPYGEGLEIIGGRYEQAENFFSDILGFILNTKMKGWYGHIPIRAMPLHELKQVFKRDKVFFANYDAEIFTS